MKYLTIFFLAIITLLSCKTTDQLLPSGPGSYRAGFVSKQGDTTWTATRAARIETVGLDSAADNRLKLVLVAYDGHGVFTVTATNLTACQGILRWNWDGNFKIDSIGYPSNDPIDPKNDVLAAGETKTFKLYSKPKPGRLKLQLKGNCGNSSELIINITTTILPITYSDFLVRYNEDLGKTFISFTIMEPTELNQVIIQQLKGKEYKTVLVMLGDDQTTHYSIKL